MLPPLDKNAFNEGFCWGEYRATISEDCRLRLNKDVAEMLREHEVKQLWRFPDPTAPAIVLCPPKMCKTYKKLAQDHLPQTMDLEKAYRQYICSGKPASIDNYNRIKIKKLCLDHAKLQPGSKVVILGVGLWLEVRRDEKFLL